MEHPAITRALRTGYPGAIENQDTPESREEFLQDTADDFLYWMKREYPEILDEYIERNELKYLSWLN